MVKQRRNVKMLLSILLGVFLLCDTGYTFFQFLNTPIDGDMAGGVVPAQDVQVILDNPLGVKAIAQDTTYANPNRYFAHWTFYTYFNKVPVALQSVSTPVQSVYLACAIAKLLIHLGLIILLARLISGGFFNFKFLISASLIVPLFQTNGYHKYMGVIDTATTYTFFYSLPLLLLLLYLSPMFMHQFHQKPYRMGILTKVFWVFFALVCALNGPLNAAIGLIISFMMLCPIVIGRQSLKFMAPGLHRGWLIVIIPLCLFSLYSIFLGTYNSVNDQQELGLATLYGRLPFGLYKILTAKIGFGLILVFLIINGLIIGGKSSILGHSSVWKLYFLGGAFILLYLLLLPLGGYREYRPNLLRNDTMLPVTVVLMFLYGLTSLTVIERLRGNVLLAYLLACVVTAFIFTLADESEFRKSDCERQAIQKIAESKEAIVVLKSECTVMSWQVVEDPVESDLQIKLMQRWQILDDDKRFRQIVGGE
jgi:hypothetical protein